MEPIEYSEEIDFQKYWLVLKRRWFPATGVFAIAVALSAFAVSRQEAAYMAEGKLLFKEDSTSALAGLKNEIGDLKGLSSKSNPLSTEAEIIRSRPIAEKTVEALGLTNEEGEPLNPKKISADLEVKTVTDTDVMQISYEADDPATAASVVNKIMEVYIQNDIQTNRAKAVAAREFIAEQLPKVEANVSQAEEGLRRFKEQNKVIALDQEANASVGIISDLDKQIAQAEAKLADASARSTALRNQIGLNSEQAVAVSSLSQSEAVQQVLEEFQKVQGELAVERTRYKEGYPTIDTLERKAAALEALLQERVAQVLGGQQAPVDNLQIGQLRENLTADLVKSEVERSGLADQVTVLRNAQSAYKQRSNVLPRLEQSQRELERKLEAAQSTYEILLNSLQETRVAENQNVGNARVISTALVPENPIASKKKLILAAGGLVGILLGITTAFLLDMIDTSIKTVKESRELFGSTLLGVIPSHGKSRKARHFFGYSEPSVPPIFARDLPRSPISEAYQMLQANLKFLSSDKAIKAIVVTSSIHHEGKSEVSANLAAAMAQVGRRVLLVDGDMRHPDQHHIWDLTNAVGLSNVLVGEAEFSSAVREVMPGLDVLTAGVIPPNSVALLDSKRMASLIETFSETYDAVIVDTPPLVGVADAPILGKMADGVLMVVRPGVLDSASAKAAKDLLIRSGQNVLGIVTNGVILGNEPDSYFYHKQEQYNAQDAASLGATTSNSSSDLERS
ncbi:polysaccharide biosynthesis tyrosine autokinase [Lyngbya aestuarii]|uniref:polysaccharide biosynthesis tyrosine autokinase n=1 Tax=Lyngbya aestuarii TaxID=118322 RepID=UPI00403D6729